jgi:predicted HTH transcriptional regulator
VDPAAAGRDVETLLDEGETHTVEYKSSLRYGYEEDRYNKYLKWAIVKTVAGFLNADGGDLLIGLDDDAHVLGLEPDLDTFDDPIDLDGYADHLRDLLSEKLSPSSANAYRVGFPEVAGTTICRVGVEPSPRPVTALHRGETRFYARHGDETLKLTGPERRQYIRERWGTA